MLLGAQGQHVSWVFMREQGLATEEKPAREEEGAPRDAQPLSNQ